MRISSLKPYFFLVIWSLACFLPGLTSLPPLDRDESRYAQASIQMMESGDYIRPFFQETPRYKKPVGAYWFQVLSVMTVSTPEARAIWAHRLPSLLGAILAVLAIFWGGKALVGRRAAFAGSMMLASCLLLGVEASIAKTDALLCGFTSLAFASLAHLRRHTGGGKGIASLFWAALGIAVLIKGPVAPLIVGLALIMLYIWEGRAGWMRPLLCWPGLLLFGLIVLPWMAGIGIVTEGKFYAQALGEDLGPKIVSGHESHGAPPGLHSALVWVLFWPASLFLLPALIFTARVFLRPRKSAEGAGFRFLWAWVLPVWLIFEIMPTKLIHYPLPLYPALSLMAGAGFVYLEERIQEGYKQHPHPGERVLPVSAWTGLLIYLVISLTLLILPLYISNAYGEFSLLTLSGSFLLLVLTGISCLFFLKKQMKNSLITSLLSGAVYAFLVLNITTPALTDLSVSQRVSNSLQRLGEHPRLNRGKLPVFSPDYAEPSLVYLLGTKTLLSDRQKALRQAFKKEGRLVIIDKLAKADGTGLTTEQALQKAAISHKMCLKNLDEIKGFNYSKGREVHLILYKTGLCLPSP